MTWKILALVAAVVAQISLAAPVLSAGNGAPTIDGALMLGSELVFTPLDRTLPFAGVSLTSVPTSLGVIVAGIDTEGHLTYQMTTDYSYTYRGPLNTFRPSGKVSTDWLPSHVDTSRQLATDVPMSSFTDDTGIGHTIAIAAGRERLLHITWISRDDPKPEYEEIHIPGITGVNSVQVILVGVRDYVEPLGVALAVWTDTHQAALLFQRPGTTWNVLARRYSQSAPWISTVGLGGSTLIFQTQPAVGRITAESWAASPGGPLQQFAAQDLSSLGVVEPIRLVWWPGDYLAVVGRKGDGYLYGALGHWHQGHVDIAPLRRFTNTPVVPRHFDAFWHFGDILSAYEGQDGVAMARLQIESDGAFAEIGKPEPLPAGPGRALGTFPIGQEVYAVAANRAGGLYWLNLKRAMLKSFFQSNGIYPYVNPYLNLPVEAVVSYTAIGSALWSLPVIYRDLYRNQPTNHCTDPRATPTVCGKFFVQIDDYRGVPPGHPDDFASLQDALGTLNGANGPSHWDLGTVFASATGIFLHSEGNVPVGFFHEIMHRGTLPAQSLKAMCIPSHIWARIS